jgi:YfdX protein
MMTKFIPLALATLALSLQAQNQPTNRPNHQSREHNAATHSSRAQMSDEVGDLLNATNEARIAVEEGNREDSLFHVNHALQNANRIEGKSQSDRIVPLYQELDRYTVLGPIMAEKHKANGTEADNRPTKNTNQQSRATNPAVQEVTGQFTSVGLDVQQAKEHLTAAKQAIERNEFDKADQALAAVQTGVVVSSVASDLPLVQARDNMTLARSAANRGDYKEAQAALTSASRALDNYSNGNGSHAAEARTLKSQIDTYNRSIQQSHNGAVSKIDSWWDEMADWASAPTEQSRR